MNNSRHRQSPSDAIVALIRRILDAISRLVTQMVLVILQGTGV
jgi:hypothetical protein